MSNFKDLYKFNDKKETTQAARRAKLLDEQKKRRQLQYSSGRDEESDYRPKTHYKVNANYKDCLMLSEWMMELPDDIEDFMLVPCPKGIRCTLVVKSQSSTLHYKSGKEFNTGIKSNLPKDTILDCFYVKSSSSIYILDVLQYKGRDFVDCDFAFRSYWIRSKFLEDEFHIFKPEDIKLKVIDTHDFNDTLKVRACYDSFPIYNDAELDGYLYYHKEGSYTFGESPLVLWLFPFMVEEVMPAYKVNPHYNTLKPDNYISYLQFINDFQETRKKTQKRLKTTEMDFETSTEIVEDYPNVTESIDLEKYGD